MTASALTETLRVVPDADLSGSWQRSAPASIDSSTYTEPRIIGSDFASYVAEDGASARVNTDVLTLPDVGVAGGGSISLVASRPYDGKSTFSTAHSPKVPDVEIQAGDVIEIVVPMQHNPSQSSGATCPGYTQRVHYHNATAFVPSITKLWKYATGSERNTTLAVTLPVATATVIWVRVIRGCDQTDPYDFASGSIASGGAAAGSQNPGAITTTSANALIIADFAGNVVPSWTPGANLSPLGGEIGAGSGQRSAAFASTTQVAAGSFDADAWTYSAAHSSFIVDAYAPAATVDLTLLVFTSATDETASTTTPAAPTTSGATFALETDVEVPSSRTGSPQGFLWRASVTSYTPGNAITIDVADHGTIHSWTAALLVVEGLNSADVIDVVGTETNGQGNRATFGALTATVEGCKLVALLAKAAPSAGFYSSGASFIDGQPPIASVPPGGMSEVGSVQGDAITLSAWQSEPLVAGQGFTPGGSSWSASELWSAVTFALEPDTPAVAGAADLYAILRDPSTLTYLEIGPVAGSMDEVVELDLDSLPSDAVPVSVTVTVEHESTSASPLHIELVGIDGSGNRVLGGEKKPGGYAPSSESGPSSVTTAPWTILAEDDSALADYSRLGVRLFSDTAAPGLTSHKVYSVSATITYLAGGPTVSSVTPPASPGNAVEWIYSSLSGLAQTSYRVMAIAGSAQDPATATVPADPLNASAGEIIADSGVLSGALVRSHTFSTPIGRGATTWAVQAYARLPNGSLISSAWATATSDISGAAPSAGSQAAKPIAFNATTGRVEATVAAPASVSRAWLLRSYDGSTFAITEESPFTVTPSVDNAVHDAHVSLGDPSVTYAVAFDNGSHTETSTPAVIGSAVSTVANAWYLQDWDDSTSILVLDDTDAAVEPGSFSVDSLRVLASTIATGKGIVSSSGDLGDELKLSIRVTSPAAVASLEAILSSGRLLLRNVLGESWACQLSATPSKRLVLLAPSPAESTPIRNAAVYSLSLLEIAAP